MCPAPFTPGSDCVRVMGGARLAAERDRAWEPDRGDVVRGRNGRDEGGVQEEVGFGDESGESAWRRELSGFREKSRNSA